jgi:HK97 family phage prohead protease
MPGAFKASLERRTPKGVWAHDWSQPIAKTLSAVETAEGLVIRGQFNLDTQRGREAFSDIKFGIIDEFSIGYRVMKESFDAEQKDIRQLDELDLFEWSPVLVGMNPATELLTIKSDVPATLDSQVDTMLAYGTQLANRFESLRDLRAKDHRQLSAAKRQQINACKDLFDRLLAVPSPKADDIDARRLLAEFLKTQIKQ